MTIQQKKPPTPSIDEKAIIQALDYPRTPYFITTNLYWDCDCDPPQSSFKPQDMPMCEDCGTFRDESPDSRINEMRLFGIHLDFHDPTVLASLEQHSTSFRTH